MRRGAWSCSMRRPNNNLPAEIVVVCGSTGSGKSHGIKARIARERCVLVWDAKNEYGSLPGFKGTHSPAEFVALARAGGRVAFAASPDQFAFFCRVVWARGDCLCIAEELAGVTGTAKACGAWHQILTQGRGYGIRTIGITQRPAEIDKTIIGNATLIRSHRLTRLNDCKAVAAELDVPIEKLRALQGFEFVERDMTAGLVRWSKPIHKSRR